MESGKIGCGGYELSTVGSKRVMDENQMEVINVYPNARVEGKLWELVHADGTRTYGARAERL